MTNEVLVLKFGQLQINPFIEDRFNLQAKIMTNTEVDLQFFK